MDTILPSFPCREGDAESAALALGDDWLPYEGTLESLGIQDGQDILLYLPSEYDVFDCAQGIHSNLGGCPER